MPRDPIAEDTPRTRTATGPKDLLHLSMRASVLRVSFPVSITFDRRGSSISPIGGTTISSSANASVVLLSFTVSVFKNSFSFGVKAERSLEGENFR